jgi:acyl transferase domain-containing protein/acyl carrier protein
MSNAEEFDAVESIAIVGMAGRFPGAGSVAQLWQNLCQGVESISFLTDEELVASGVEPAVFNHPNYVKAKPVLDRMEMFDASFFGYTPREAELMDPQHRVFIESAWAALEDAGYDADRYDGKIGVFAGASLSTYLINAWQSLNGAASLGALQQLGIGNGLGTFATRVSYKLNLRGPSVSVQTACSTSLAAVHLAAQSLLNYHCDMALAGGVSIIIPNREGYYYQEGAIFSPDGHCRSFDARAQGTIVGDGVGIVVLKRLSEALADGDYIHAVIKGSAMNNDGSQKVGFTAPSVDGQVEVVAEAQAVAGVSPESIGYVEAHGTATPMGDPIEVRALTKAFRAGTERKQFCAIGSIKPNIGHLDTAAGVAGLIKTALALRHRTLPPTLHFEQPNPEIDFANSPFYVNTKLAAWETDAPVRRAGVSSFGFGGTNVHVVLEEAPSLPQPSGQTRPYQILALSAKTEDALDNAQENLLAHLEAHTELNLADIAYTYLVGRRAFGERRIVVCRDRDDAIGALRGDEPQRIQSATVAENRDRPVVFMFPGQGAQHVNMALELYRSEPTFRRHVDDCAAILVRHLGVDLRSIIFPREAEVEQATERLNQTQLTQPALFVVEYALARLWMEWGVQPQAMIGHSIGEYVAACLAGVFSLEDALALVAARGRLLQKLPGGSMLAVSLPEQELRPLIAGRRLAVAAHNAPSLCVVSGTHGEVADFETLLLDKAVTSRRLHTSHAFHSEMVEPALKEFTALVGRLELNAPRLPFLSNVTGNWITAEEATDPAYWAKHLRQTVRFAEGVQELLKEPERILLEVGPGQTLSRLARQQPPPPGGAQSLVLASLRHPNAEQPDAAHFTGTLGKLWLAGVKIDWMQYYANETRRRLPLPTYPFEAQRHWIDAQPQEAASPQTEAFKRPNVADWLYTPVWKQSAPPLVSDEGNSADQNNRWLVFADECGIGARLSETLRREGCDVILLRAGAQFAPEADGSYTINPQEAEDYRKLMRVLRETGSLPRKILHLWSVGRNEGATDALTLFDEAQTRGVYSLLYLAKAIGEQTLSERTELFVVSNNLQSVTGEESLCPEKATLLGLCKVVPQEYLNLSCRSIDILLPASGTRREAVLIEQLLAECRTKSTDTEVAFRGDFRWVQAFERVDTSSDHARHTRLKTGGVYLIVGGLGSIGLTLAEVLARSVRARLVLTVNADFPERAAWDAHTAERGETDAVTRQIRHVQELERLGATVLLAKAGSERRGGLRSVVSLAIEQFGGIDGVVYAERTSISDEEMVRTLQELERDDCERQFAERAQALYGLEDALQGLEPDFLLFISSISSTLGGIGLGAYTAVNLFTDAFARSYADKTATRSVSVNLDSWQTAEEKERHQATNIGASLSEMSISPQEGAEVFTRLFSNLNAPQVIVSTGDLQARVNQWVKRLSVSKPAQRGRNAGATHAARSKAMKSYVAPRNETEQKIASIWQEVLGHAEIGVEDNFFELGGDSLLATQLVSRLRDALQAEISLRKFFESATIAGLAAILETAAQPSAQHKATKIKPIARDSIRVSRSSLTAATPTR